MGLVGGERPLDAGVLLVGEVLRPGAQDVLDPVPRVILAAAVPGGRLLHPPPYLVHALGAEGDDVEDVEHGGGPGQLLIDRGPIPVKRVEGRDLHPALNCPPRWVSQSACAFFERPGTGPADGP